MAQVGAQGRAQRSARAAAMAGIMAAGVLIQAVSTPAFANPAAPGSTTPDPAEKAVAYCRSVGDNNMVNAVPPDILSEAAKAMGVTLPTDADTRAVWRCMDGAVMVCIAGGPRYCGRAGTQVVPSPEARKFCQANVSAPEIPTWATGRDTIFNWRCQGTEPAVASAARTVDKRGFVQEYWRAYEPGQQPKP